MITDKEKVLIFDTTLRDGEQCPGATMTREEKLAVARALDVLRVDIIEAGFPAASPGDFEAVSDIAGEVSYSTVCALARASKDDVRTAAEALQRAERKRIHTFISCSPLHMKHKLKLQPEEVLEAIRISVGLARSLVPEVQWGCEDSTRSDPDFLAACVEGAIKAGATTINLADTVGYSLPGELGNLINDLVARVPGADEVRFSAHCHNDLGLAVANALGAVRAGARQVECTVNGIGERAGNAALEEIVMAISTRGNDLGVETGVRTEGLTEISRLVAATTGFLVPPNKAIVGANAFAHESGIHQHGVLMNRGTYEIIDPVKVGADGTQIVLGKHSGRHGFKDKLNHLGIRLSENMLQDAFHRFKKLADTQKYVDDDALIALVADYVDQQPSAMSVRQLAVEMDADGVVTARIEVTTPDGVLTGKAVGDGAMRAIPNAISDAVSNNIHLIFSSMHAISAAGKPQVKASVRLQFPAGEQRIGHALSEDPNMALASALLNAMPRLEPGGLAEPENESAPELALHERP
jgi:2-isopropylmalate synthase